MQCTDYLTRNCLISDAQSGFRKGYSTGTCLSEFLHTIYSSIDAGGACGVLFLDLAKAFDTVDHDIMLYKLRCLGFRLSTRIWFESYLKGRKQCTIVGGHMSSEKSIQCGVPQGSILGPLLFSLYVNDIDQHLKMSQKFLYADDTALVVPGHNLCHIQKTLSSELNVIGKWFCANKLSMNLTKTNCMLFRSKFLRWPDFKLNLKYENIPIKEVNVFKYLGVFLDPLLTFECHAKKIIAKVNQRIGMMWRIRSCISKNLAIDLYKSLIDPLFLYCCHLYDACSVSTARQLQTCQNKALRAVLSKGNRYSTDLLHSESEVEWLGVQRAKTTCTEIYKLVNNIGPRNLCKFLEINEPCRVLRSNAKVKLSGPSAKLVATKQNFLVRGIRYWDILDAHVQTSPSLWSFKARIKKSDFFNNAHFTNYKNLMYV